MDDWDWVYELIENKYEPEMELPEDLLYYFLHKSPMVQIIIERLDLELER